MRRCLGCMRKYNEEYDICPHCGYIYGTQATSKSHLPPGTVLQDRYLLGKVLGQGGFGITYIAWDLRLEKAVAVKEFFPTAFASRMTGQNDVSCFNAESRQYFDSGLQKMMNESRLLARFTDQTNIVQVLDCIEENGTAYIIMELLRGETVQSVLTRERKLSLERTMQIILPILQALETIHRTGLVHRDISPDNIFVCDDGKVKLLDFGAARIATGQDHKTLSVMLKKGFAPIEQYSSHGKQGPFTDVYAVCATMYKMLTGVTPESSLDRMGQDTMRPLSEFADVPDPVAKVVQRGMEVEASERIQIAGELYNRLQRALQDVERTQKKKEQKASKEKRAKRAQSAASDAADTAPVPSSDKQSRSAEARAQSGKKTNRPKSRRSVLIAAVSLVLVAAIVVGIVGVAALLSDKLTARSKVGDVVSFGKYGLDGESPQKIKWIVLDRVGDEALLLSRDVLDYRTNHDEDGKSFTWETSDIREWLNTDFYNAAFSDKYKARIALHENETQDNPVYGTSGGNNTTDRCFLLSVEEVETYLPAEEKRIAEYTNAVQKRDFADSDADDKAIGWMLRSPGNDPAVASGNQSFLDVESDGAFYYHTDGFHYSGVRPALWANVTGNSGDAGTEWVSGYRDHLYDFSWTLQNGTLHLSGEGTMPRLEYTVWSSESKNDVKSVVIDNGFTSISDCAFEDCVNLTSVQIPQSVEEIGFSAFQNCAKLKTVSLPSSVTRIGTSVFTGSGVVSADGAYWKDNMLCVGRCLIRVSRGLKGSFKVPDAVKVIAEGAFRDCSISHVSIPNGVTRLDSVFVDCKKLQSVDLPNSIVIINDAFSYCDALKDILLPNGLERIESGFYGCESLKKIVLPQSLRHIGSQAFCCCWALEAVAMHAGIEEIESSAFFNCPSIRTVLFYGTQSDWNAMRIGTDNELLTDAAIEFRSAENDPLSGVQKGDTVLFGHYEQDGNTSNGDEPVEWIVLSAGNNGQMLLLSKYVLDCHPYHTDQADVTWASCEMRQHLNNAFYDSCFSAEEQALIRPRYQSNPDNKSYKTKGGAGTVDNVRLLTLQQAQAMDPAYLMVRPTAYAVSQGAFVNEENGNTWWSLRSPGSGNALNALVRSNGDIPAGGDRVNANGGVRPAIWVIVP